jgi:flagellar protein FlbT
MTSKAPAHAARRDRRGRLVLEIRAGDRMVVNGAALEFTSRTSILLSNRARFLFGKQLMAPEKATTPSRRIYFAIQSAYVAEQPERPGFVALARSLSADYMVATTSEEVRSVLRRALADLEADRGWEALQAVRALFPHDDAMLGFEVG